MSATTHIRPSEREHGQVLPLLALTMLVAAGACLLVGRLAGHAVLAARARTAADAAALAGAVADDRAAGDLAARNGGILVALQRRADITGVEVDVGGERVHARASSASSASVVAMRRSAMAPVVRAALARAEQILGHPVDAIPVADDPLAVDVPAGADALAPVAARVGLHRTHGASVRFRVGAG